MALTGVALLAAAFTGVASGGDAATSRVLRLNASDTAIEFLDPALNYDFIGWRLEYLTCARLLAYPDKPGAAGARLVPEVAKGMPRVTRNGRTYTFTVRRDFRFSDGTRVTPGSFVRSTGWLKVLARSPPSVSAIGWTSTIRPTRSAGSAR